MSELISAALAHKLANPTNAEGLARYKATVAGAIREAALGGIEQIQLRIPIDFESEIVWWIKEQGYVVEAIEESIDEQSFYSISWRSPR